MINSAVSSTRIRLGPGAFFFVSSPMADSQIYLAFNPACPEELSTIKSTIETCIADVRVWMFLNFLKLKHDKSEVMVFHSQHNPHPVTKSAFWHLRNILRI